ncbi:hybrid non-ribosomal peptide synthetase/type I polyketide synthase [Chondromyces crocatus]|uniref:Peptide synthetase n=1 Tax=Chondromyces crocatus TaxID=52 RepID=A0A0K1E810_CHOCO|nr:hybrid non-ribosomal peptide synthetase/type I polyketide synthase [Chondromyces crocatus]AKT36703.1 peptide synthetase [Chondromyces crocatus]
MKRIEEHPVSFEQERIWLLNRIHGPSPALHELGGVWIDGECDVARLSAALRSIAGRHCMLRARFVDRAGKPRQVISADPRIDFELILLDGGSDEAAMRAAQDAASLPFSSLTAPLWRVRLVRVHPRRHFLVLSLHDLVADDTSIGLLLAELFAAYRGHPLAGVALHYLEYARAQATSVETVIEDEESAFFRRQLAGAPPALEFWGDGIERQGGSLETGTADCHVDPVLTERLRRMAGGDAGSLEAAILAALAIVLHRCSGQPGVVVAVRTAGRSQPGSERLIGHVGNLVPVAVWFDEETTWERLVARLRSSIREARARGQTPYQRMVETLAPPRTPGRPPLAQVFFHQREPLPELDGGPGLKVTCADLRLPWSAFDITASFLTHSKNTTLRIEHRLDLLTQAAGRRLLNHWEQILRSSVDAPDVPVSSLSLLPEDERCALIDIWNSTSADFQRDACIHQLFEQQVDLQPYAQALVLESRSLTYIELERRANQLAYRLRELGVGPETLVACCMERSVESIVAFLGILKAGGAYLPLDPSYPAERLAFILEDSGAHVTLTLERHIDRLPPCQTTRLCLDTDWPDISLRSTSRSRAHVHPANVAYGIYTSGSTGRPKGVLVEHRQGVQLVEAQRNAFSVGRGDRVLQLVSLGFDVSVGDFILALCAGATLCLVPPGDALPGPSLAAHLRRYRPTLATFVPSVLAQHPLEELPELETLVVIGEACPASLVDRWAPGRRFVNAYGPTEATVYATTTDCQPGAGTPPIGRPMANARTYVLDAHGQPVPVGVAGELYLGGCGVTRGYLKRAALTAERFLPDPFHLEAGARMYRTGDRVRWREDGELEFLGRLDHQVKIRGVRVELGEVEARLREHPTVGEALVTTRETTQGNLSLVAYVVAASPSSRSASPSHPPCTVDPSEEGLSTKALREFLRTHLPDAMVPSTFVVLASFPLSPNGKIDRRALPAPAESRQDLASPYEAPTDALEKHLVTLWQELLGIRQIGVNDDFFALGGHSLQAVQVFSRIRQKHRLDVSFTELFAAPTVAALAALIRTRTPIAQESICTIPSAPRGGPLPLSFAQERLWFLHRLAPESTAYICPAFFRLEGPLDAEALSRSLHDLTQRHEILRTTFVEQEGLPIQCIHDGRARLVEQADLSDLPPIEREAEVRRRIDTELARPFDLENGPLFRAALLRLGPEEHVLLLDFHHIVTDGWSMGVALREIAVLYEANRNGAPSPLSPLPVQYGDYAAWQRALDEDPFQPHLDYWRETLANVAPLLELPADRARPPALSFRGATASFRIGAAEAQALRALASARSLTPTMALLTAYAALLHRYTHRDDLLIGIPVAGRDRVELEGSLGFFVNTVPVRLDLSGDPTFEELLQRVGQASVAAYEHASVPFERLVQELRIARSPSYNPLVQVAFAPQPPGERHLDLEGVISHPITAKARSTIFDLSLFCWEESDGSVIGAFEHSTDLFDDWRIAAMIRHFLRLVQGAATTPGTKLSALPLLAPEEQAELLGSMGRGPRLELPTTRCLHELFEEQADRNPHTPAVIASGHMLTYRELDEASNRLARRLREAGAGGTLVASCLKHSIDVVVAFFGVLKAGATYLPLDPAHPTDRLAFLIEDSGAPVLLCHADTAGRLPDRCKITLQLSTIEAGREPGTTARLPSQVRPADPAYVIYTSGSTGRPKGVVVEHRNAVHLVEAGRGLLGLRPGARVLQTAALGFDASIWELLMTLCAGATLYIEPSYAVMPGPDLSRSLRRHRITSVFLPPSVLAQQPVEAFPDLETIIVGGEACPADLVDRWAKSRRLINAYGPTECTVASTMTECHPGRGAPPIGRPLANVRALPLGPHGELVPVGVPGELHIGGPGVARGYLRRPELTMERFIENPFDDTPGARLYRTGDWVRFRPDGQLEFLGRIDDQVKVSGVRIELQEIEAALGEHPAVQEAAVLLREDTPGERRLVAYVVPRPGCPGIAIEKGTIEAEQIEDWRNLYEDTYGRAVSSGGDITFNISGWASSYTHGPIPADVMRSWRNSTVARILALQPERVWEIGCGTGLLLYQVAPRCAEYLGTDFSESAIALLRHGTAEQGLDHVRLERREATDVRPADEGRFDVVVLNSIIQYFPDARYLERVIEGAVRAVRPGGVIFIGDVRSLPLLPAFHASVERHRAPPRLPSEMLGERVRHAIATESELVLAPELFHRFAHDLLGLGGAEVWTKRGRHDDEMTRFRYDVVLHVGQPPPSVVVERVLRFCQLTGSLTSIERWLRDERPRAAEVTGIPCARVYQDAQCLEQLGISSHTPEGHAARAAVAPTAIIEPEELWQLGEQLGYEVRVSPGRDDPYTVDVLFEKTSIEQPRRWWSRAYAAESIATPLANDPVSGKRAQRLLPSLRAALQHRLPDYMVPRAFVALERIPLTPNGKVDRRALPPPDRKKSELTRDFTLPRTPLEESLCAIWRDLLDLEQVGIDNPFFDLGGYSLLLPRMGALIEARLGRSLRMVELFEHATVRSLAGHLEATAEPSALPLKPARQDVALAPPLPVTPSTTQDRGPPGAIAIIGMAGRFPGARNVEELWQNLCGGVESITLSTPEQLATAGVDSALLKHPRFVPAVGVVADAQGFDASFFGYSPRDAALMDPQHRAFLECAHEALESAGYGPRSMNGGGPQHDEHDELDARIGIFGGCDAPRYWLEQLGRTAEPLSVDEYQVLIGNTPDMLTTRAAYKLNLRGPALNLVTACSTSLVAVHVACQSLRLGECNLALAGASVILPPDRLGHVAEEGALVSPDGHCRPFDAAAQGIVGASGVALVALKRLEDALADGDTIHAVIRGSAIGNDGASKNNFPAPSADGQIDVISRAQKAAGVDADSVGFVEAHGTATALGDLIEVSALTRAFRRHTDRRNYCALGSLKGNIGHTGATAGVAGLIKAALSLQHGVIPPTLHFDRPNPNLDLDTSPFYVNSEARPWPSGTTPRRAGVSAFGVGGTNAHVILEEPPAPAAASSSRGAQLFVLSARTERALDTATERLAAHLTAGAPSDGAPRPEPADIAFTLQVGRAEFQERRAVVASDAATAASRLRTRDPAWGCTARSDGARPKVVFMFPGGGSQDGAMGRVLYQTEPVYRQALDQVASLFADALGIDMRTLLFADGSDRAQADARLHAPAVNLATIFATEHALSELLCAWGVIPEAVTGHSLGEYAAARLAGVLSLEDAVALVALRGRLYEELPRDSATMSVPLSEAELRPLMSEALSLAAINASDLSVVSGARAPIAALEAELRDRGIEPRRLPLAVAAHSRLIAPLSSRLGQRAETMKRGSPRLPIVSNVTGGWLTEQEARDPHYWSRHLASTVRFSEGLTTLLDDPAHVLVEVGPGRTLTTLARRHPAAASRLVVTTLAGASSSRDDLESLLLTLGQLWCAGVPVDFRAMWRHERRQRVPLPTYPFQRTIHVARSGAASSHPATGSGRSFESIQPSTPIPSVPRPTLPSPAPGSIPPPSARSSNIYVAVRDSISQMVATIWGEALGIHQFRPDDNFFDLGGSSLGSVKVLRLVQERLGIQLESHALAHDPTFAGFLARIRSKLAPPGDATEAPPSSISGGSAPPSRRSKLLVPLHDGGSLASQRDAALSLHTAAQPLFLIHPIGGTVMTYRPLAGFLGASLPVFGIRASGTAPGEAILDDITEIAARYVKELRAHQPYGPYRIGGHSAGGVIAYEVVRQLLEAGQNVAFLTLIDTPSLDGLRRLRVETTADLRRYAETFRERMPDDYESFVTALDDEQGLAKVMMATWSAITRYEPTPIDTGLVYIRAKDDVDPGDPHPERFWASLSGNPFTQYGVRGNHFSMLKAKHVHDVARWLERHLKEEDTPTRRHGNASESVLTADRFHWVS